MFCLYTFRPLLSIIRRHTQHYKRTTIHISEHKFSSQHHMKFGITRGTKRKNDGYSTQKNISENIIIIKGNT